MKIILVEDDHLQSSFIVKGLKQAIPLIEIMLFETEHEFRSNLDNIISFSPDVAIFDIMIRWTNPAREMPAAPPDVKMEKHFTAGIRCQKLLREKAPKIPAIFYSVLEAQDLNQGETGDIALLSKDSNLNPLIDKIRSLVL